MTAYTASVGTVNAARLASDGIPLLWHLDEPLRAQDLGGGVAQFPAAVVEQLRRIPFGEEGHVSGDNRLLLGGVPYRMTPVGSPETPKTPAPGVSQERALQT